MMDAPSQARATAPEPAERLPFGVYVHVPYCRRRCPYCDFYFEVRRADPGFAKALHEELRARLDPEAGDFATLPLGKGTTGGNGEARKRENDRSLSPQSLYFGGGTPTALDDDSIAAIIQGVRDALGLPLAAEITVEANPEDLPPGRCAALARAGVNRLSLGIQSFEDDVLQYLGRAHTGAQAEDVVLRAQDEGIERISVDLIAGVPGEREGRLEREIERILGLRVGHVSTYLLTVEPETPLERLIQLGRRKPLSEDAQADAYERLQELLPDIGLRQYEVSSFARPGQESRHNRLYWSKGMYLGLGPGAHSMRLLDDGRVERRQTTARLDAWLEDPAHAEIETEILPAPEAFLEAVAFGLRDLVAGVCLDDLAERHRVGIPDSLLRVLDDAMDRGLVTRTDEVLHLTETGARFADAVARDVLTASE